MNQTTSLPSAALDVLHHTGDAIYPVLQKGVVLFTRLLSDVDTGGYTTLDFALHDSHVLSANVFMQLLGRVGIFCVLLYNIYSSTWVPYLL